ncbi:MFS transporter [Bacillus salitolerans]|uniref:MFS transporter n=1 Tax=Bacillus salitolerans TaxID=1437434 RepID=A0ABW4LV46_9BACI
MFSLLKNKQYFRFWSAQVISQLGDGITRLAIMYLVAILSKDPFMIGLVIFAQLLPTAVFGVFLGPLADRYNRKWLMVGSDVYRMLIVLVMLIFHDSAPILILLIVLQGLGSAIFDPARSASIPDIVGEENIQQAISLSQGTRSAMDIIGPSIGGLLLVAGNYTVIFLIDASTFLLSAFLLIGLTISTKKVDEHHPTSKENYRQSLVTGIREVVKIPALRFLLVLLMPVTLVVGVLNTNLVAVLTNVFEVSGAHFGLLESSLGIGAIAGALFIGPLFMKHVRPSVLLLLGTIAIGCWMLVIIPLDGLRLSYGIAPVYAWCIMIGVLNTLINVPLSSLFLGTTPAYFRGRGSSLLGATANSFQMIGILFGGWIAGLIGILNGVAFAGALLIFVVLFIPFLRGYKDLHQIIPKKRKLQQTGSQAAID